EVVAFLDPDCEPVPGWLEAIERTFADSSVVLACGVRRPAEGSSLLRAIGEYEMVKDEIVLGGSDPEIVYGYTSNMAVRASVFAEIGCFVDLARGADTLFVREVARRRGMDAIRFVPEMEVVHHELDSLAVYYRKVFLYAQNRERNNAILASRPLSGAERMRIFGEVVRRGRYSPVRAAMLLAALGTGSIAWRAGRLAHRFGAAPSLPTSPTGPSGDPQGRK
ncbi:MAG: glycosyltransferase, partial [Alphaproteobacteria bacterium]